MIVLGIVSFSQFPTRMSTYYYSQIRRDGFISAFGRFMTEPGRMDRVEGSQLRRMYLPKLSREGQKELRYNSNFIRSQLQHYGVRFEEREFSGQGTALMKAALQARKCDQVPDHIINLQNQMHEEWLSASTLGVISAQPDWVMQKYFLSAGQPDRTKTTTVVGIPFDRFSGRSGKMIEAASKVTGLHHMKAFSWVRSFSWVGIKQLWTRQPINTEQGGYRMRKTSGRVGEKKYIWTIPTAVASRQRTSLPSALTLLVVRLFRVSTQTWQIII